jgi:peptide-methionine (S)-S-oxide reductase
LFEKEFEVDKINGEICRISFFEHFSRGETMHEELRESAIFAGGCFWCLQCDFDQVTGILETKVGYTGGEEVNPSYEEVSSGMTGHVEAVEVTFDPLQVSYQQLLEIFWHNIDPTRNDGQFCDVGAQYRPIIFYQNSLQQTLAEESKKKLIEENRIKPIVVEILPAKIFYPAEKYHQEYYRKNPVRYKFYRYNCGRDRRLRALWGFH